LATYTAALNSEATVRDYAVQFISNLTVTNVESIQLQAATLASLTDTTSELTRQTVV
jgi:hypothetical protein